MPLSDSQVKAEQAGLRRRNVSVGDSLFLVIESATRGGGKSFEGRMRFPPGRQGKQALDLQQGVRVLKAAQTQSNEQGSRNN